MADFFFQTLCRSHNIWTWAVFIISPLWLDLIKGLRCHHKNQKCLRYLKFWNLHNHGYLNNYHLRHCLLLLSMTKKWWLLKCGSKYLNGTKCIQTSSNDGLCCPGHHPPWYVHFRPIWFISRIKCVNIYCNKMEARRMLFGWIRSECVCQILS